MPKRELTPEEREQVDKDWPEQPAEPVKGELVGITEQALVQYQAPEQVIEFFRTVRSEVVDDPEAAAISIISRILAADDIAGVFDDKQVIHSGEITWQPLILHGVKWCRSQFDNGPGVFALMECDVENGDKDILISCSGLNIMAQIYRLDQLNAFPLPVQIEPSPRPTARGYTPLWLKLRTEAEPVA